MTILVEMTDRGIKMGKLSVDKSAATMFTVDPKTHEIIPPFSSIDSLGQSLATKIIEERSKKKFTSIDDFVSRCKVSPAIVASLRDLGAFGDLPEAAQMTLDEFM